MARKILWFVAAAVLTAVAAAPSFAQVVQPLAPAKYAWNDWQHRLSLGVTGRYEFTNFRDQADAFQPGKEWTVGGVGAYEVTDHFTIIAGSLYGLDTKFIRSYVGGVIPLYGGP